MLVPRRALSIGLLLAWCGLGATLSGCSSAVGASCGDGGNICSDQCVVVDTDPANCGACGHQCEPGAICSGGTCACPGNEKTCTGACVDTSTDVNNCGGCGQVCGGASARCQGGSCEETLASSQSSPFALAVSDAGVFWTTAPNSRDGGTVVQVGLNGGTPQTLATDQPNPHGIAVDGSNVYWTSFREGGGTTGYIVTAPVGGGSVVTLTTLPGSQPNNVTVDSSGIYVDDGANAQILKISLDGNTIQTLANGQNNPAAIAVSNGTVFWATNAPGDILSVPESGSAMISTIASGQTDPKSMSVVGGNAFWITYTAGAVVQSTVLASGTPSTLISGEAFPSGLACDGTNIYWTTGSVGGSGGAQPTGTIMRIPVGGGRPTTVASGQIQPVQVAVDATSVYWITSVGGTVEKLTPK